MKSYAVLFSVWVSLSLSLSSPVPRDSCECGIPARSLLKSLTDLMKKKEQQKNMGFLFAGFICSDLEALMVPHTQTASVCKPSSGTSENMSCSSSRNSPFRSEECLRNIRADLLYYDQILNSYKSTQNTNITDLSPVLTHTRNLKQCLNRHATVEERFPEGGVHVQTQLWSGNSFSNRVSLCKSLKGFLIRTVTINRALAYVAVGDHRK